MQSKLVRVFFLLLWNFRFYRNAWNMFFVGMELGAAKEIAMTAKQSGTLQEIEKLVHECCFSGGDRSKGAELMSAISRVVRDAERWQFCEVNGFPRYIVPHSARHFFGNPMKEASPATAGCWIATVEKTQNLFRGETAAAAIDAARSEGGK